MTSSKPVLTDADRASYPTHLLEGCETGICLFAAAFLGLNDAAHFEEAGLRATCVDTDEGRLGQMSFYYPRDWRWQVMDAWDAANTALLAGLQWDAVSVDPFRGDAMDRALQTLDLWTALARKFVTVGIPSGAWATPERPVPIPLGWRLNVLPRSASASWLVLERR